MTADRTILQIEASIAVNVHVVNYVSQCHVPLPNGMAVLTRANPNRNKAAERKTSGISHLGKAERLKSLKKLSSWRAIAKLGSRWQTRYNSMTGMGGRGQWGVGSLEWGSGEKDGRFHFWYTP